MSSSALGECGAHGVANEVTGQCDCMDDAGSLSGANKWTGVFCQNPPVNIPCVKSSDEFRAKYGGDAACGNWGKYGMCDEVTGTCSCGTVDPFFGVRCQNECTSDSNCGGTLARLPDGTNRDIGVCNRRTMQCACKNGWSGTQCRVEPAGEKCYNDAECTWGGQVRGACDESSQKCVCLQDDKGRPLFRGNRCSERIVYEGAACKQDKDCADKSNKCVSGKCKGNDSSSSGMSPDELAAAALAGIWSPTGLATMLVDIGAEQMAEGIYKTIAKPIYASISKSVGELVGNKAISKATAKVGTEMTAKMAAQAASKAATKTAVSTAASQATQASAKASAGPIGWILLVLQVWAAVLDIYDSRGLNMQATQDQLDMMEKQFIAYVNSTKSLLDAGLTLPLIYYPEFTVAYNAEMRAPDTQAQIVNDAADYISKLTVNSNGQTIVPMFYTPTLQAEVEKQEQYPVYWSMANNNVRVFNNLVDYGWSIWLLISLIVVSITLICVFTSDSVTSKLKKK
jgi:hypothetical protein